MRTETCGQDIKKYRDMKTGTEEDRDMRKGYRGGPRHNDRIQRRTET